MSKDSVIIIDYGSGNLRSAERACAHMIQERGLSADVKISNKPQDIANATRIILPGQGAFGDCIENLRGIDGMIEALEDAVLKKSAPFLGICVGMQLMATRGLEHGVHGGLDWISGEVVPFQTDDPDLKIPHMGWNDLVLPMSSAQDNTPPQLKSIKTQDGGGEHYYFVHSFVFKCDYNHHVLAMCNYGGLFAAIVGRDNMMGVQFHPEKSSDSGLRLIGDFLEWAP